MRTVSKFTHFTALIVDDMQAMRGNLRQQLSLLEISQVDQAMNADEAIRALHKASYHLVLCDYNLGSGSTGQQLRGSDVIDLVPALTRPFLLAGGISAHNRADYESVVEHPQFFGIDVDTAARDDRGRFESASVTDLTRGWRTACYHREIA